MGDLQARGSSRTFRSRRIRSVTVRHSKSWFHRSTRFSMEAVKAEEQRNLLESVLPKSGHSSAHRASTLPTLPFSGVPIPSTYWAYQLTNPIGLQALWQCSGIIRPARRLAETQPRACGTPPLQRDGSTGMLCGDRVSWARAPRRSSSTGFQLITAECKAVWTLGEAITVRILFGGRES
jgi:hypothetical protein